MKDAGIGIAPEDRENLFREFDRSEGAAEIRGSGFGLVITQHLATLMGGRIFVTSEVNRGTCVEATFPARAESSQT